MIMKGLFFLTVLFVNTIVMCQTTTIIGFGSNWNYYNQGNLPNANWFSPAYIPTGWASANSEFGFGDGDETTVIGYGPDPQNKYITTYFRKEISLSGTGAWSATIKVDDACVVYFNGTEVFRENLPTGTIGYSTLGISPTANENTLHTFSIPSNLIINGQNLFAVEMHQGEITSSDLSFDFKLTLDPNGCNANIQNTQTTLCEGESTNFFGQTLTQTGNYTHTISDTSRVKTANIPIGAIRWDNWHPIIYNQNDPSTYNDVAVKAASGFSMVNPEYRQYAPFHSIDIPTVNVNVNTHYDAGAGGWQFEPRWYNMNFRGNEQWVMDAELDYAVEAGLDYWMFLFYSNGSPLRYARELYTNTPNKKGIKMAYCLHQMGGGQDYLDAIQTIVSAMNQPWYQKIDGKPLLFVSDGQLTQLNDVRAAYGLQNEIYVVYQPIYPSAQLSDVQIIQNNQMNAIGSYSSFGDNSNHLYSTIAQQDVDKITQFLSSPIDIAPTLTISFFNKPMYTHSLSAPINLGNSYIYNTVATNAELQAHIQNMLSLCEANNTKVKTMVCYAWNEHYEGGKVLCPSKNINGTINQDVVDVFESVLWSSETCDSVYNLALTIENPTSVITPLSNSLQVNSISGGTYQWYSCSTNTPIQGATGTTFSPTLSGQYYVITTTNNNCQSTSDCALVQLGLNDIKLETIKVYPNPANSNLKLITVQSDNNGTMTIYDSKGNKMLNTNYTNEMEIDISGLSQGVYIIRIENEKNTFQTKFTKQ